MRQRVPAPHALIVLAALTLAAILPACMGVVGGDELEGTEAGLLGVEMELGEIYEPYVDDAFDGELRVVDGLAVLEGDIVLGPIASLELEEDTRSTQSVGIVNTCGYLVNNKCLKYRYLWPNGVVRYQIKATFSKSKRDEIKAALNHWRNKTPLRFVAATSGDRVVFEPSESSCAATLGYIPNQNGWVRVSSSCGKGSLIHEIGHVVGMWHEHTRCNRNTFVKIVWDNIEKKYRDNFNRHCKDGETYTGYDYDSIMHYGSRAFSKNGKRTIKKLKSGPAIGQRVGLSAKDILGVKKRYASEL